MVHYERLLRVFWPAEYISAESRGVLIGWRNSELDFFVTAVLQDVEVRNVENALKLGTLFRNSPHDTKTLLQRCSHAAMQVMGVLNPAEPPASPSPTTIAAYTHRSTTLPRIVINGGNSDSLTVQVIVFSRPHPTRMQYMSLEPILLALGNNAVMSNSKEPPLDDIDAAERMEKARVAELTEKMKLHTIIKYAPSQQELSLPSIIDQMNCSFEINALVQKNLGVVRRRARRTLSVSERVVESATDLWFYIRQLILYIALELIWPIAISVFIHGLIAHRIVGELILLLMDWRPKPKGVALKDISATAQQIDLRLQQFCYWPVQYLTLRERKNDWESITNSHPEYIRFYNSLWLVANDVIIGMAIGSYIIVNSEVLAAQADGFLKEWSLEGLRTVIAWLMDDPAGLKLNNNLARFLGDLFLWVIDYWTECMITLQPSFPHIVRFIGFASFAGASMPFALCSDLLSLVTLHIYCFYIASARIYSWQLTIIASLFHLFRGKKRNILRKRIDSCDYELDQLLLGTILFTLLFFLLPTVVVFYFTFALARMAIISLKALFDTMLACLNHFPLFALMLRVKDSRRLPGGICFVLTDPPRVFHNDERPSSSTVSYILLKSTPLSLQAIFHEYFQFGNRIKKHYLSANVFFQFATGGFVPPLHRKNLYGLQYSMLPDQRYGINELWERIKGSGTGPGSVTGSGGTAGAGLAFGYGYSLANGHRMNSMKSSGANGTTRKNH